MIGVSALLLLCISSKNEKLNWIVIQVSLVPSSSQRASPWLHTKLKFNGRMDEFTLFAVRISSNNILKTAFFAVTILGLHFAVLFGYVP